MTWNGTLLRWRLRTLLPITLLFGVVNGGVALSRTSILSWWFDTVGLGLVAGHGLAIGWPLGRRRSASEFFLLSHGFSRATLWNHTFAAATISVLLAWLPVALVVWSPLRAMVQDRVLANEWFPFVAPFEAAYPVHWLIHGYLWLVLWQHLLVAPTSRGADSRSADLLLGVIVAVTLLFGRDDYLGDPGPREQFWWTAIAGACAILLTLSNRSRDRDREVQP